MFIQKKDDKSPCHFRTAPFMVVSLINCTDLSVQKDLNRMKAFFLSYSNSLIKHAQVVRELEKELGNTSKRV